MTHARTYRGNVRGETPDQQQQQNSAENENKGFAKAWQRHLFCGIRFIYCYFVSCSIESEVLRLLQIQCFGIHTQNETRFFSPMFDPRLKPKKNCRGSKN